MKLSSNNAKCQIKTQKVNIGLQIAVQLQSNRYKMKPRTVTHLQVIMQVLRVSMQQVHTLSLRDVSSGHPLLPNGQFYLGLGCHCYTFLFLIHTEFLDSKPILVYNKQTVSANVCLWSCVSQCVLQSSDTSDTTKLLNCTNQPQPSMCIMGIVICLLLIGICTHTTVAKVFFPNALYLRSDFNNTCYALICIHMHIKRRLLFQQICKRSLSLQQLVLHV